MKLKKYILEFTSPNSLISLIYFFSLLFMYSSNIGNFFYLKITSLMIVFISSLTFILRLYKKKINLIKFINEYKFSLLLFFSFFVLYAIYTNFYSPGIYGFGAFLNLTTSLAHKQSCADLPLIICNNWSTIYFFYLLLLLIIFNFFSEINFSKLFINCGLIYCLIGIFYYLIMLIYSQINLTGYYKLSFYLEFAPEMMRIFPHFSLTYTPSSRNYEVFPIIVAKLFLIYELVLNGKNTKKILTFCLFSIFIFYSYSRLMWIIDGIMMILLFFLIKEKSKILKLLSVNIISIIICLGLFSYIYNFSKILYWESNYNVRTNITYYTLSRVSTLFSSKLSNFFHKKNEKAWFYYAPSNLKKKVINDEFENQKQKEIFFDENVKEIMNYNFNSNTQRKNIYLDGINYFLKKPMGHGVMNIPIRGSNAESGILQVALEVGIFGLIFFSLILIYPVRIFFLNKNLLSRILLIFCFIIILSQIFTIYIWYNFLWFYFAMIFYFNKKIRNHER